jgi:hypothetical protein
MILAKPKAIKTDLAIHCQAAMSLAKKAINK